MTMAPMKVRLFSKIKMPASPGDCWEWIGGKNSLGYGLFYRDGRQGGAHRATYEVYNGPIADGLVIDHLCHNTGCVNPDHLRAVTRKQNQEHRQGPNRGSRSGERGVRWCSQKRKWQALVGHNYERHHGGYFETVDEAAEAARQLRLRLHTHSDKDKNEGNE